MFVIPVSYNNISLITDKCELSNVGFIKHIANLKNYFSEEFNNKVDLNEAANLTKILL